MRHAQKLGTMLLAPKKGLFLARNWRTMAWLNCLTETRAPLESMPATILTNAVCILVRPACTPIPSAHRVRRRAHFLSPFLEKGR